MARLLIIIGLLLVASPAMANCVQQRGGDFESSMGRAIDYLICLHNEHDARLLEQIRLIGDIAELGGALEDRFWQLQDQLSEQALTIQRLESRISTIAVELSDAMGKSYELEREIERLRYRLDQQ